MNNKIKLSLAAVPVALALTACGSGQAVPLPTSADYAAQSAMVISHPGQNCFMSYVGYYQTTCYAYGVHPPYSVHVYAPRGCTCPAPLARPNNYRAPSRVTVNHTTVVNNHTTVVHH